MTTTEKAGLLLFIVGIMDIVVRDGGTFPMLICFAGMLLLIFGGDYNDHKK